MKSNKNILAFILIFMMLFSNVTPVLAAEINKPLTMSQVSVKNFENNKDAEVELRVENTTNKDIVAKLIVGLYESTSNKMITYNYVSDTIGANQVKNWGTCIPVPSEGEYKIKAFAWDKMDKPTTISNMVLINKEKPVLTVAEQVYTAINKTAAYQIENTNDPGIGTIGGDWTVFSLARANYQVPENYYENYYSKVLHKAKAEHAKQGNRWDNKVTDVERVAIGLTAIGRNPENVDGINLLDYIWNKGGNFPNIKPDGVLGHRQGANELVFALLALDTKNYKQSDNATITRDEIINRILNEYQLESGGFGLNDKTTMSLDITGMAIQALAPYYDKKPEVKIAIDKAITVLSNKQGSDGKYLINFGENKAKTLESIAQAIVALTAMDIDPHTDKRFVKNENSLITALLTFYDENGGFKHIVGGKINPIATDQGLYALVAYDRFKEGKNSLYNMDDVQSINIKPVQPVITTNLANKTVDKEEFTFTVSAKDSSDKKIEPVVIVNSVEKKGTNDSYKVILKKGKNVIKVIATDSEGHKEEKIFTINYEEKAPVGKVKLSIEKRTIGKGDPLSLTEVDLYEKDTPWDVLKRITDEKGIKIKHTY
ncbi:MAG: terpene cyclase/mutase family protein, partial [Anaeromicrobium sp.]|uniref:prenyltransferase/squalene oxidase repeat-containing protein n=1 Tax=Anaeromicrobium sp. TaxID=1929132 RepID=UPI0025EF2A64